MTVALTISVTFSRGAYSGAELGTPELLPSPARLQAAFASAAAGGPWAEEGDGRVLMARPEHAAAVRWLEDHELLGLIPPQTRATEYGAVRHRLRAAREPYQNETGFEPFSALDGPVVYVWPAAEDRVVEGLSALAREITHVGRAEGTAVVDVRQGDLDLAVPGFAGLASGRGRGMALRVATEGRFDALMAAHREALKKSGHGSGSKSRQAKDEQPDRADDRHTRLRRFAAALAQWPYAEAWRMAVATPSAAWILAPERRVALAVAVHRAIIAEIGSDVPEFVTGRDGEGPMRGSGHLAIHATRWGEKCRPTIMLALPDGVPSADRATLLTTLERGLQVKFGGRRLRLGAPHVEPALPFWQTHSGLLGSEVPIVLDAPGTPRKVPWTLEDAVVCSVGYAMRGVLEDEGLEWGSGWGFRRELVAHLRARGVDARARRVRTSASRYVHRARPGDLLVAVDAIVRLGELGNGEGLLALGRARHLGGGLLRPLLGGRGT